MIQTVEDRAPVLITRQNGESCVLMSLDEYNSLEETAYLMRTCETARRGLFPAGPFRFYFAGIFFSALTPSKNPSPVTSGPRETVFFMNGPGFSTMLPFIFNPTVRVAQINAL